jgi:glycogen phosphorylase
MIDTLSLLREQYGCGPIKLSGTDDALYERHLIFDRVVDPASADPHDRWEAAAHAFRDVISQRWLKTEKTYELNNPKRVYYLSMEFLLGRSLANNVMNSMLLPLVLDVTHDQGLDWSGLLETEPDAGLGNGGLGRLAACFIDSMATLEMPGMGYGLRYEYGIFKQTMRNGWQYEQPDNWLRWPDPWEVARSEETVEVKLNCSFEPHSGALRPVFGRPSNLLGIPFDRPVIGYGGSTINTLRLWAVSTPDYFDFQQFSRGEFVGALAETLAAESLTRVLYPDDSTSMGQGLRFLQEYVLVACSIADLVRRFRRANNDWNALPDKIAIQMNDTHPAMAVCELMRVLLDEARLDWERAWSLTQRSLGFTNHTLLPEALEKWPLKWFEALIPRNLEIIYEINRRLLDAVSARYPGDPGRLQRMSLIEESGMERKVRMANLAVVGSHSVNGVAAIHSELLRTRVVRDFADMFPERFNNKTNGVTPRRWLLLANPWLSSLIREAIGDGWITDLSQLSGLKPFAADSGFRDEFQKAKLEAKIRFAAWVKSAHGFSVDPLSIFDCQVKRIHEYKRQLLNVLHIIILCNRLRDNRDLVFTPRCFIFAGKAAPAYELAKLIIKLINNVAGTIEGDPLLRERLKVLFLPDYNVSMAERLIPAADVSEQISTAGFEASGTSNMKFMMNGALTVGTRDGATIEMAEEAGEENLFLFGLTAEQVVNGRGWYDPHWHYHNEPETRAALDLLFSDHFSRHEPGTFNPIRDALLKNGDFYRHLADLKAYSEAQQRVAAAYVDRVTWSTKAIMNVASSGKFSSDRAVAEYAREIWGATPCPVSQPVFQRWH